MAKIFADRIFMAINGFEVLELETLDWSFNPNLTRVETMTRNRRSAGFRKGNKAVNLTATLANPNDIAGINLSLKDPSNVATIVLEQGADKFTFIDVEQGEMTGTGSVGNATKTLNLEALDFIDENGNSRLSDLSL